MTRWVEAIATTSVIFDRGLGFIEDLVGELIRNLDIARCHFTPYYPQWTSLVEKVNGMIVKMIAKQVHIKPKDWDWHLQAAFCKQPCGVIKPHLGLP